MVEKLLEFLVYKVDPELFKGVALKSKDLKIELILKLLIVFYLHSTKTYIKNLKSGNVQYSNVVGRRSV